MADGDLKRVLAWRNADHVRPYMFTTHVIAWDEHVAWWERVKQDPRVRYFIFEIDERPLGMVGIVDIDSANGTANWGYYLGELERPPGSGGAMEYLALEQIFEVVGARKLVCEVFSDNAPALKLHAKFGFVQEGYRKEQRVQDGVLKDVVELALFARDWPETAERMAAIVFREA